MLHRTLLGAALLGLVGLPYVLSTNKSEQPQPDAAFPQDLLAAAPSPPGVPQRLPAVPAASFAPAGDAPGTAPPSPGRAPARLEDVFNFNLTAEQVLHTWPMVTTTTNQPDLKGYRVPLVTGGRPDSLAGSLTYFFNNEQQLQRIVFHGTTGDPQPLVQLAMQKFELKIDSAADAAVQRYVVRWSGRVVSELRVQPAQLVDAREPLRRFAVNLLIERPQKVRWFPGGGSPISGLRL